MSYIEISHATASFNVRAQKFVAFEDVSLKIEKGEFVCILGASGCGKSTLLNAIAGFVPVTEGSVVIDGVEVKRPSTRRVMIFQNYGLLPWRTVVGNVELGLEQNPKLSKKERRDVAEKYVELVGLSSFRKSYPRQLSGGMQQRTSIARALAVKPDVVFMDEPFGALDAITRMKLQDDVLKISQEEKTTIVFVTHDIGEAVYLADRIVILSSSPGRVKCIINVPEGRDFRNRASDSFASIQKKTLELFNLAPTRDPIEYYI